jgi:integrase
MSKLTAKKIQSKLKPGMHNDGAGLYLRVTSTGAKSWILRCRVHGAKRDIGLGGISYVSLAEARKKATTMRAVARTGGDPLAERNRAKGIPTFEEAALAVWGEQVEPRALDSKHKVQWLKSLRDYAFPVIGDRRVDLIQPPDILQVLQPIWLEKPETARRVRQRLRAVFDWAAVKQYRESRSPLVGIENALPKQENMTRHFAAMPFDEVPAFLQTLEGRDGVATLALRFLIITAARSGEVRGATWSEIDRKAAVWTIPAERMKAKKDHRVPLTAEALEVLDAARGLDPDLVFPGQKRGRPMPDATLSRIPKRVGQGDVTVHGFRSTFRDWASERTNAPREIAEMCLAHTVGSAVERAYARSDLFEKRRNLMGRWARFCSTRSADIIEMGRKS